MKFIYCPECNDAVLLHISVEPRTCLCGESWGRYVNDIDALIGGKAIPFGINNMAWAYAFHGQLFTFEGWFYRNQSIDSDNIIMEYDPRAQEYLECTCPNGVAEGILEGPICTYCKEEAERRNNGKTPF